MSLATAFWCVLIGLFLWAKMYSYERALFAPDKKSATYYAGKKTERDGSENDRRIARAAILVMIQASNGRCQLTGIKCGTDTHADDAPEAGHKISQFFGGDEEPENLELQSKAANIEIGACWLKRSVDLLRKRGETVYMTPEQRHKYWFPDCETLEQFRAERKRRGLKRCCV